MGETVAYVGPDGAGQVVKACNQIVVALIIKAVGALPATGDQPLQTTSIYYAPPEYRESTGSTSDSRS